MIDILIDPLVWMTVALCISILLALFQRNCARCAVLLTGLTVLLILIASPFFANRWLGMLEDQYPSAACSVEAKKVPIVALAGGYSSGYSNLGMSSRLSNSSKNRALAAANIAPEDSLLFLSGGSIRAGQANEADAMAELIQPMLADGVQLRTEIESTDTYTNAVAIGLVLDQMSVERKIVLISSASHLPRAAAVFEKQGFQVCAHSVDPLQAQVYLSTAFLPRSTAIERTRIAIHEWIGMMYYKHLDWI